MTRNLVVFALACVTALGGCASTGGLTSNEAVGTGVGVTGGAIAGAVIARSAGINPLVGAVIGGVAGGVIGQAIGAALDEQEKQRLAEASVQAASTARVGQRVAWSGARSAQGKPSRASRKPEAPPPQSEAASGWVVPTSEVYQASNGKTCRNLHQVAIKSEKTYEQNVVACQTASGWEIPGS